MRSSDKGTATQRDDHSRPSFYHTFLQGRFPSLVVQDQHKSTLSVKIEGTVVLADLFATLEEIKLELGLADYSASQTSLEQIFLRYAREVIEVPTMPAPIFAPGGNQPLSPSVVSALTPPVLPVGARFDPTTGKPLSVQAE
jgi:hypothetical protein